MWLVLSSPDDGGAAVMAQRLRRHGLNPLIHAATEELGCARWVYQAGTGGETSQVTLHDGRVLDSSGLRGVLNRLVAVPATALVQVAKADRDYASHELTALYTSWLFSLTCPVINRPTGAGLCGHWPDRSEWLRQAFAAGLPAASYRLMATESPWSGWIPPANGAGQRVETVILLDGAVADGQPPADLVPGCVRLAKRCGNRLVGLQFVVDASTSWRFMDATPMPDLAAAGDGLTDALAAALGGS